MHYSCQLFFMVDGIKIDILSSDKGRSLDQGRSLLAK